MTDLSTHPTAGPAADPLDVVETALSAAGCGPRRRGETIEARCPAHDDSTPSLSVAAGTHQPVILTCHANCRPADVVAALGLDWAQLCARRTGGRRDGLGEPLATYLYRDEFGHPLYRVVRFVPKTFRQQRWDGRRWVSGLGDTARVLYRLPELTDAVAAGRTVWVCEGEKDADAAARLGLPATCNPMGAGKWRQEYSAVLAEADVIVVADNDRAGYSHAAEVGRSLVAYGATVTYRLPAEGCKDLTDHLVAGHHVDQLRTVTAAELAALALAQRAPDQATGPPADPVAEASDVVEVGGGNPGAPGPGPEGEAPGRTQAARLVTLARREFRLVMGADAKGYAVANDGPAVALWLRGKGEFKTRLAKRLWETTGEAAGSGGLDDALTILEGMAADTDPVPVALRVATHPDTGAAVLDLGTPDGAAVIVHPAGWSIVPRSPVLFRRTPLTAPIPAPVGGGSLDGLGELLNVDQPGFRLIVGWLVAALIPDIAHPILTLLGEQGTAKTTACRLVVSVVDPSPAPVRSAPKDLRDWASTAVASWVVGVDNISAIPPWLSDTWCRAVTGDAFVARALFTDADISVLTFRRVIALTSIDAGRLAGDLAERLLTIELNRIDPARRRTDADINRRYETARPAVLGALLDLTSQVLAVLPTVQLAEAPRMADFARILGAVDHVTGWDTLDDYRHVLETASTAVLEADPVATAVLAFVDHAGDWEGTAAELHRHLTPHNPPRTWPANHQSLAGTMRRLATDLRGHGIDVDFIRRSDGTRRITLRDAR